MQGHTEIFWFLKEKFPLIINTMEKWIQKRKD